MSTEKEIWQGSPSQWENAQSIAICILLCWLIVPLFVIIYKRIYTKRHKFRITNQRIVEEFGVFHTTINETELQRVKDIRYEQTFFQKLFGLSTITLITSDVSNVITIINYVKNGRQLREDIRNAVEERRKEIGVRELDTFGR
ncbi:MAG: PH domain-containing protein [Bacteroidales bacterium]|jgi:membrane protein YdbS with pleckstrin-like domain|nr:PH domain-containing protein [Bacteroidales bacterium]